MSPALRTWLLIPLAVALAVILMAAFGRLPPVGHYAGPYGDAIIARALPERHVTETVAAVTFDYRGYDTFLEEFMFFAAVTGTTLLLRFMRGDTDGALVFAVQARSSSTTRLAALVLLALTLVFGLHVVWHGTVTPGGGFQGGTIIASGLLLAYFGGGMPVMRAARKTILEIAEGIGAMGMAVLGLAGLSAGGALFCNVLPLGTAGHPFSGGMIWVANAAVGLEVAAGMSLLGLEFLQQAPPEEHRE